MRYIRTYYYYYYSNNTVSFFFNSFLYSFEPAQLAVLRALWSVKRLSREKLVSENEKVFNDNLRCYSTGFSIIERQNFRMLYTLSFFDFEPRNDLRVFLTWNPEHDFYGQIFISAYFLNTPYPFRGSSTISNWRLQYLFHWCVHWMNNSPEPFPLVIPEDGKNLWLKYTHGADSTRSASFSLIPFILTEKSWVFVTCTTAT